VESQEEVLNIEALLRPKRMARTTRRCRQQTLSRRSHRSLRDIPQGGQELVGWVLREITILGLSIRKGLV
jgi:hypothetical protein